GREQEGRLHGVAHLLSPPSSLAIIIPLYTHRSHCPRRSGSSYCASRSTSFRNSSEGDFGTATCRMTNWSPRSTVPGVGTPFPLSRSFRPLEEPGGTVTMTGPSTVGTWILAPFTASE